MVLFHLCNFPIMSFYNLWRIMCADVRVTRFNISCLLGCKLNSVNMGLLIPKIFLLHLFLHLNPKVGWTKWFWVFLFSSYIAANMVLCIPVWLCKDSFSLPLHNVILIAQENNHTFFGKSIYLWLVSQRRCFHGPA